MGQDKSKIKKYRRYFIAAGVLIIFLPPPILYVYLSSQTLVFSPDNWKKVRIGMEKKVVINLMGTPRKICKKPDGKKKLACKLEGYGGSPSIDAEEVYTYQTVEQVFYIFFDKEEKVVNLFVTGS